MTRALVALLTCLVVGCLSQCPTTCAPDENCYRSLTELPATYRCREPCGDDLCLPGASCGQGVDGEIRCFDDDDGADGGTSFGFAGALLPCILIGCCVCLVIICLQRGRRPRRGVSNSGYYDPYAYDGPVHTSPTPVPATAVNLNFPSDTPHGPVQGSPVNANYQDYNNAFA
eukprot:gene3122-3660_t